MLGVNEVSAVKKVYFLFTETMIYYAHPASTEGRIAIVTTREVGMRWTWICRATSGNDADVKSRGPGAPTLAPSLTDDDRSGDGG